ncbi:MAG: phosphohydrolase, partial [Fusobacterium sp. JB020]|nr:phosphohydrolase [Fusobacterium sp. JB020]
MKKFRFFGIKLILKLEKENKDDIEIYSSAYNLKEKIMYLMLAMSFIILTAKVMPLLSRNHYKQGNIIKENIYSPKTFKYNDTVKR